jgi:hypothetical protein
MTVKYHISTFSSCILFNGNEISKVKTTRTQSQLFNKMLNSIIQFAKIVVQYTEDESFWAFVAKPEPHPSTGVVTQFMEEILNCALSDQEPHRSSEPGLDIMPLPIFFLINFRILEKGHFVTTLTLKAPKDTHTLFYEFFSYNVLWVKNSLSTCRLCAMIFCWMIVFIIYDLVLFQVDIKIIRVYNSVCFEILTGNIVQCPTSSCLMRTGEN